MQDTGRLSGGADLRRAVNAIRENPHDMLEEELRADASVREIRDARALGRLRTDLAAIRVGQVRRLGGPDGARRGWQESLAARLPVRLLAEVALSCGLLVALVMFWNTFGSAFVTAVAGQPVP